MPQNDIKFSQFLRLCFAKMPQNDLKLLHFFRSLFSKNWKSEKKSGLAEKIFQRH